MVFDPRQLDKSGFSGPGWTTRHAETATVLGIVDKIAKLADDARHAGPKTLAVNMGAISGLHPTLSESYGRFRRLVADTSTEALADMDGNNKPLMAADDAIALIGVLAKSMITRDGVQQVQENVTALREAIAMLDRAITSPDAPLPIHNR